MNPFLKLRDAIVALKNKYLTKEKAAPFYFTISSTTVSIAQMIAGVIVVRAIVPQDLGVWQSVNLASTYSAILLGGVGNGLSRELPYYLGADDHKTANRLAGTTLFYNDTMCVLALIGGAATTAYLLFNHADIKVVLGVVVVTLGLVFTFTQNYLFSICRSNSSFSALAGVQMWQTFLIIATLPLLYLLRYEGMLLRIALMGGILTYLMYRVRPMKLGPAWNTEAFMMLLKTGIPIFALDYLRSVSTTSDRVALLYAGGVKQVGLYALALSVYGAAQVIPNSISHYVYPRMSFQFGRDRNPRALWRMAWKASLVSVVILLPLALIGWFVLPFLVQALFPKYGEVTYAAQIALLAGVCSGAATGVNALWSMKAWRAMIGYQVALSALTAVAPFIGIRLFSSPLAGVAYGLLGAQFLAAVVAMVLTYVATHPPVKVPEPGY